MNQIRIITIIAALLGLGSFVGVLALAPVTPTRRPPTNPVHMPVRPETSIDRVRDALAEGRTRSALELASRIVELRPASTEGWMWLAYLERQAGEPERARDAANKLLGMIEARLEGVGRPSSTYAYQRAWALEVLGREREARDGFRLTAELYEIESGDYRPPSVEYNLACYLAMAGLHDAACDHFETWVEQDGHISQGWWATDPDLDPIRTHPRFIDAVNGMAQPSPDRRRTRGMGPTDASTSGPDNQP